MTIFRATLILVAWLALVHFVPVSTTADDNLPSSPAIYRAGYPHAFFFRTAEGFAANDAVGYDRWDACFSRLMGIQGKVLDEEVPGRERRNVDFFTRFKREHPDQLVLLHYNGNARDPRYQTEKYHAGHWVYCNGATILDDVPAEPGETEIRVSDPTLFRTEVGRYRWSNEDVGLCLLDEEGRPDWNHSEQVQLVSVDPARKVIRVRRGSYGTVPRAFPAGRSYAAAHMSEGPWGRKSNLMWYYNYSTRCPLDEDGKSCADVHAAELAARLVAGGKLAAFDGLEFDVLHHEVGHGTPGRGADCDADGKIDNGYFDGVNQYGIGVVEFCRKLRAAVGEETILQADGANAHNQRAFGLLNGIESEGWPHLSDWEIRDWSGGLNRHFYWQQNARRPVFNYINHKFTTAGAQPGERVLPEVPWAVHRLVLAAAVFTDSAITYSFAPPKARGELYGIWDELRKGAENELGWLGQPLGPAVRLAQRQADVLAGAGKPAGDALLARCNGEGVTLAIDAGCLKVTASDPQARQLRFRLRDVPCEGPELFVSVTAHGSPMQGYPAEVARLMSVGIAPPPGRLVVADLPASGMCVRGGEERQLDSESGASLLFRGACKLGDQTHAAYLVHPPYRATKGYTFWSRDVDVPPGGSLQFFTGMGPKSPSRSDGVVFQVAVAELHDDRPGEFTTIFEHAQKSNRWMPHCVALARWAGKRVRLKFISDCGPNDNSTADHSHWGDVAVLGPEGREGTTEPVRFMTWLGPRDFQSGFYFSAVRSAKVDLEFVLEGPEPIWISAITAHHHPDATYREFDNGLVLANPSPRPYTFDLARLFPNRKFRRLQATPLQDTTANNGAPVGTKLTLGPQEGLFLVAL